MKNFKLIMAFLITLPICMFGQQESEIRSDGIIVPKITNAERPSPAALGHLVYNTSQNQFEYYNGSNWVPFSSGGGGISDIIQTTGGESYVKVTDGVTSDYIDLRVDNNTRFRVIENSDNVCRLEVFNNGDNLLIGQGAGVNIGNNGANQGDNNIALGRNALNAAVTNDNNVAIGNYALKTVAQNQSSQTIFGNNNVAVGHLALGEVDNLTTGSVAVGFEAGKDGGANSVYIGQSAGVSSTDNGSNRLFIANGSGKPLIYGEFDNNFVEVDGQLMATLQGTNTSPTYVGVLESTAKRPSLLFSIGGNQSFSGMAIEYDSRSTMVQSQLNFRNDLNSIVYSLFEDGDIELYGDIDRPGGELDLRAGGNLGITIETNGEVGIGTTNPSAKLHVVGQARITGLGNGGTGDVQADNDGNLIKVPSDIRLKKDIATIEGALDKVLKLRGVSYNWKHMSNHNKTLGVIAQEVIDVVPEVVRDDGEYLGVNYSEFPALFIEAFKEQQRIIDELKSIINQKDSLLRELSTRVGKLESLNSN